MKNQEKLNTVETYEAPRMDLGTGRLGGLCVITYTRAWVKVEQRAPISDAPNGEWTSQVLFFSHEAAENIIGLLLDTDNIKLVKTEKLSLAQYLKDNTAKTEQWVKEQKEQGKEAFAFYLVDDVAFWEKDGIDTVEKLERYELEQDLWDAYKDAYGIRPRHLDLKNLSDKELEETIEDCYAVIKREIDAEEAAR